MTDCSRSALGTLRTMAPLALLTHEILGCDDIYKPDCFKLASGSVAFAGCVTGARGEIPDEASSTGGTLLNGGRSFARGRLLYTWINDKHLRGCGALPDTLRYLGFRAFHMFTTASGSLHCGRSFVLADI